MKIAHCIVATSVALLLAACGGGGGGEPPAAPQAADQVPQSALASAEAFSRFVGSLPVSDSGNALALADTQPPLSETAEPLPVN